MSFVVRSLAAEKEREMFFPDHSIVCRTCYKPRVKRLINLEDFSVRYQKLICMFGHPHDRVPAAGRTIATGGTPAAIVPAGGGGGVPPVPVFHAGHGPHINPL